MPDPAKKESAIRDSRGRFIRGNPGGGRPKGSKHRLSDIFVDDVMQQWEKSGPAILRHLAVHDKKAFAQIVLQLIPKDFQVDMKVEEVGAIEIDYTGLDDDDEALHFRVRPGEHITDGRLYDEHEDQVNAGIEDGSVQRLTASDTDQSSVYTPSNNGASTVPVRNGCEADPNEHAKAEMEKSTTAAEDAAFRRHQKRVEDARREAAGVPSVYHD